MRKKRFKMFFSSLLFRFYSPDLIFNPLGKHADAFFFHVWAKFFSGKKPNYPVYFPWLGPEPDLVLFYHLANVTGMPKTGL